MKYFTVAIALASNQFIAVAGLGCKATCDESSGHLTFEGVEDLFIDGAAPLALDRELTDARKGVVDVEKLLDEKVVEAGNVVGAALHERGEALTAAINHTLYSQLKEKVNRNRLLIREERQSIANHLDCGAAGFVWDETSKSCVPLRIHTCGPLESDDPHWDNRAKTEADCHGITGTECRTRCLPGWSGEEVTYTCTDSGSWKRIPSHGNRDQECYNVDECSLPDYPCPDRTYQCTDTDGSFSCGCSFSMVEFGNTCDCPNDSYWRITKPETEMGNPQADPNQMVTYCTCPYGGDTNMVPDSAGQCDCPSNYGKELQSYPTVPLFGIENQNSNNLNFHCFPLTLRAKTLYLYDFKDWLNLGEVETFDSAGNRNTPQSASMTPSGYYANVFPGSRCIDGNYGNFCHSASQSGGTLSINYATDVEIVQITVHNRDGCCQSRWGGAKLKLIASGGNDVWAGTIAYNSNDMQHWYPA